MKLFKLESRLSIYFKKILFWKINAWLNFFCHRWSLYLNKIQILLNVHNKDTWAYTHFLKCIITLELITTQRSFLKTLREPKHRSKQKTLNMTISLTLREHNFLTFFEYLHIISEPVLRRNHIRSHYYITSSFLLFKLSNFTFFPGFFDESFTRWKMPIFFYYKFNFETIMKKMMYKNHISSAVYFDLCKLFFRELGAISAGLRLKKLKRVKKVPSNKF